MTSIPWPQSRETAPRVYEGGTSYQVFVLDNVIPDYHVLYKSEVIELR